HRDHGHLPSFPTRRSSDLLVAYAFAVQVFLTADGVTAPAHDEAWRDTRAQQGGIAQHIEDQRAVHIHRALDVDGVGAFRVIVVRSEEHTSELQSRENLVCR